MAMDSEGVFYIGEVDYNSGLNGGRLVSYKYSADTPTVPDTELTIYSLEENSGIRPVSYTNLCLQKWVGFFLWKNVVTLWQAWTLDLLSAQIKTPLHKFAEA